MLERHGPVAEEDEFLERHGPVAEEDDSLEAGGENLAAGEKFLKVVDGEDEEAVETDFCERRHGGEWFECDSGGVSAKFDCI